MMTLSAEAARIFRITHVSNVPWMLEHGLHCQSSEVADPNFVPIGMAELIQKRVARRVGTGPGGTLGDYIPFYFTPKSIMMYNIKIGHNGVIKRANDEIVILVSSMHKLNDLGIQFVFTNGHAYVEESESFDQLCDLGEIDWQLLKSGDFTRDPEDPGKLVRYQAEALVYRHMPVDALLGSHATMKQ